MPWAQLHDEARAVAASLQALGVVPGDHVAILGPTSRGRSSPPSRAAGWRAAASMVLPLPMRHGFARGVRGPTRNRIRHGDAQLLLIDDDLAAFYEPVPGDPPMRALARRWRPARPGADALERPRRPTPNALVILQYTSGSTSEPKGVMLPDRVLGANLDAIADGRRARPRRRRAGVVAAAVPRHGPGRAAHPAHDDAAPTSCSAAPQDFLATPGHWMQWISDYRGTATAGPNFSWVLAARALRRMSDLDLSSMRVALNGAEPDRPRRRRGLRRRGRAASASAPAPCSAPSAWPRSPSAGTFPPPMRGMVTDAVDRVALQEKREALRRRRSTIPATTRRLPLLGRPVPGLEIKVVDPATGDDLAEREVGELLIRGTSVTPGYYKRPDATAELFRDGWLRTGDLAYLLDGELVLCGRIKDVIIVGGRNVFPEDIERAVGDVDGVRAGNVIAFGVEGYKSKETVVVVAETKRTGDLERAPPRHPPPHARGVRPAAARRDARAARHAAQDELGQAAALAVQAAVPLEEHLPLVPA